MKTKAQTAPTKNTQNKKDLPSAHRHERPPESTDVDPDADSLLSGVFGAGKTRSAAIMVAGLLVFDPDVKIMILTKENVAAQALQST